MAPPPPPSRRMSLERPAAPARVRRVSLGHPRNRTMSLSVDRPFLPMHLRAVPQPGTKRRIETVPEKSWFSVLVRRHNFMFIPMALLIAATAATLVLYAWAFYTMAAPPNADQVCCHFWTRLFDPSFRLLGYYYYVDCNAQFCQQHCS